MTSSSPSQELTAGTGTTVRAASAGAASTQRNEEASNALGTEEFATTRPRVGGKRKRDDTKYFQMLSDKGKAVFEEFREYIMTQHVVATGSVDQYLRHIARYLYFLEQTTSKEGGDGEDNNGFIHHISEERFDAFVEWYGKRAEERGYGDNDQKTPSVALSHLLRMFLELDDEEENLMGGGGNLPPEKRRFRETTHLSLAQAREIIRKNMNVQKRRTDKETFFNLRPGKDSAVMKKRVEKRLEKKEARANGTVATTLGSGVQRVMSSDTVIAISKELERDILKASNVAEFMNASLTMIQFALQLHTLMRPHEISSLRLSGLTVSSMQRKVFNSAMPVMQFRFVVLEFKGSLKMVKGSGQNVNRPFERVCILHSLTSLCSIGAVARDIHVQFQILGREIDFKARCGDIDDERQRIGFAWRKEVVLSGAFNPDAYTSANTLSKGANVNSTFIANREKVQVPSNAFDDVYTRVGEGASKFHRQNNTYLRHTAVTHAINRTSDSGTKVEISNIGGWEQEGKAAKVMQDSYAFSHAFHALAALAGTSSDAAGNTTYVLQNRRDTLVVDEALIVVYANGLVVKARKARDDQVDNRAVDQDADIVHFCGSITEYAIVFWRDIATLCATDETALNSWFVKTAILDVIKGKPEAERAWESLLERAKAAMREEFEQNRFDGRSEVQAMNANNVNTICRHQTMIGEQVLEQLSVNRRASEQQSRTFVDQFIRGARDFLAAYDGTPSTNNGAPSMRRSLTTTTTTPSPPQEERVVQQQVPLNRVQNSTSIPELKRNYVSDVKGTYMQEKLKSLKSGAGVDDVEQRRTLIRKTQNLINQHRFNATHNFANLNEALQRCDEAEFGARLLRRAQVEARQMTGRVSDVINPNIVRNELRRVAKALNERVRSESFDNDEARKSFLLRALGDEWPSQ
jgi:hypothetical protein